MLKTRTRFLLRRLVCGLAALSALSFLPAAHAGDDFVQALRSTYGEAAASRGRELELLLKQLRSAPVDEQLHQVNRFFNAFEFRADSKQWGREDYWASPIEFIGQFAGDCEDYAIGKFFALRWLGLKSSSMQLSYVHDVNRGLYHIVLQVDLEDGREAMILDNMNPHVLAASRRQDLIKVVGFGETQTAVALPGGGERTFIRAGRWSMHEWDGVLSRTIAGPQPRHPEERMQALSSPAPSDGAFALQWVSWAVR